MDLGSRAWIERSGRSAGAGGTERAPKGRQSAKLMCDMKGSHFLGRLLAALLAGCAASAFSASTSTITNISLLPTREVRLDLMVQFGKSYSCEVSTDLLNWGMMGAFNQVQTNRLTIVDTASSPARFYRVRELGPPQFAFGLLHYAEAGQFSGNAVTPSLNKPLFFKEYSTTMTAVADQPFPASTSVLFSGPSSSGMNGVTALASASSMDDYSALYVSPRVQSSVGAPTGTWLVNYRGTNISFVNNLQPLPRLVVVAPTVALSGGTVQSVSWVYRDRLGANVLSSPPTFMKNIEVQLNGAAGELYKSAALSPSPSNHVLTQSVTWADVRTLFVAYDDVDGNHYVLTFSKQP